MYEIAGYAAGIVGGILATLTAGIALAAIYRASVWWRGRREREARRSIAAAYPIRTYDITSAYPAHREFGPPEPYRGEHLEYLRPITAAMKLRINSEYGKHHAN